MSIKDPSDLHTNNVKAKEETLEKKRKKRRRHLLWRWIPGIVFGTLSLVLLLLALSGLYIWRTEAGTRYAWIAAKVLSGHRLHGVLELGSLQKGVVLREVKWRDTALEVSIDRIESQWAWQRIPSSWSWRWIVPFIRVGQVQVKQTALLHDKHARNASGLPKKLTSPFLLQINEASIERLRIEKGAQVSEWTHLHMQFETIGKGKEQRHHVRIYSLQTPYGKLQAQVSLAASSPFALTGNASLVALKTYQKPSALLRFDAKEDRFDVRLSGSLEEAIVDITASGRTLKGKGHIEVWPFKKMLLKEGNVTVDHFNPRIFSTNAPQADVHMRARFWPASVPQAPQLTSSTDRLKQAFKQSLNTSAKGTQEAQQFTVEGDVVLRNAIAGSLMEHKLPVRQARIHLRLNAVEQLFSGIQIQVLQLPIATTPSLFLTEGNTDTQSSGKVTRIEPLFTRGTTKANKGADLLLEGEGRFLQGKGALNLRVQSLELHRWFALLVHTRLNGMLTWKLNPTPNQQELEIILESDAVASAVMHAKQHAHADSDSTQRAAQSINLPHLAAADLDSDKKAPFIKTLKSVEPGQKSKPLQTQLKPQKNSSSQAQLLGLRIKAEMSAGEVEWVGQLHAGQGRMQMSGFLEKGGALPHQSAYEIRSTFDEFNPFAWLNPAVHTRFAKQAHFINEPEHDKKLPSSVRDALLCMISGYVNVQSHWKASSHASLFLHSLKGQRMQVQQCTTSVDSQACKKAVSGALSASGPHSSVAVKSLLEHVIHPPKEPEPSFHIEFALHDSVYQGRPLQAQGQIHTAGQRLLPSNIKLAVAGNTLEAQGALGSAVNQLNFDLNAPDLSHIGWGLAGQIKAKGELYGGSEHPQIGLNYEAHAVTVGQNHVRYAKGQAALKEGVNGTLSWKSDVQGLLLPQIALDIFHIDIAGTQAKHTVEVHAKGKLQKQKIDLKLAAQGRLRLSDTAPAQKKIDWQGELTQFVHHGLPEVQLNAPANLGFTLSQATAPNSKQKARKDSTFALDSLDIAHVQAQIEGAKLNMQAFHYSPTHMYSSGTLNGVDLRRLTQKLQGEGLDVLSFIAINISHLPDSLCQVLEPGLSSELCVPRKLEGPADVPATLGPETNLILDGSWDAAYQDARAKGHAELHRRTGDVVLQTALGARIPLDLQTLVARMEALPKNGLNARLDAQSNQFGAVHAHISSPLSEVSFISDPSAFEVWKKKTPIAGELDITLPTMEPIGNTLGVSVRLAGSAALRLKIAGTVARPLLSGRLDADHLGSTFLQQGITFKDGIVRVALSNNAIDFEQVSFQGVKGIVTLTGKAKIDPINPMHPVLDARISAKELALFATLDRQLFLSGQASLHYAGPGLEGENADPLRVEGAFKVDRALFDLPSSAAPKLGEDVIEIDRTIWKAHQREQKRTEHIAKRSQEEKKGAGGSGSHSEDQTTVFDNYKTQAPPLNPSLFNTLPLANIHIDLGEYCQFRGAGADLYLGGALAVHSAPGKALHANGDIQVLEGSTFEAFSRKLKIERGYFAFNGPLDNPGINILAMRRNQEVEAGVSVTGTVHSPEVRLISEPDKPDSEKLSWLLFGHGLSGGTNLSQENTTMAALALLGNVSGKHIAKTIGLDEFNIGPSEAGLADPQVITVAKVLSERFILGYEQSLSTAASLVKLTWQLSRRWSIAAHTGTIDGVDIIHRQRFD